MYQYKYQKYKIKYLELKNNLLGGGIDTARNYFFSNIQELYNNIISDDYLKEQLEGSMNEEPMNDGQFKLPNKEEVGNLSKDAIKILLKPVIDLIIKEVDDTNIIDFVIQIYLNNGMGIPNSIENIGRLKDSIAQFKILQKSKLNDDKILINSEKFGFQSLTELENFIESKKDTLKEIEKEKQEKQEKKDKKRTEMIELQKKGENDVKIILEGNKYIIFNPTSEAGSKWYGRNTKWCTASENNNMFESYAGKGPLYIIQPYENKHQKFQIHFETASFMNDKDIPITDKELEVINSDEKIKNWLNENIEKYLEKNINLIRFSFKKDNEEYILNQYEKSLKKLESVSYLKDISNRLRNDKNFFKILISKLKTQHDIVDDYGRLKRKISRMNVLECIGNKLKDDEDIINLGLEESIWAFNICADKKKDDYDYILKKINEGSTGIGEILRFTSDRLRKNKDLIILAISNTVKTYQWIHDDMKNDVDILITYLKKVLTIATNNSTFDYYLIKIPNRNIPDANSIVSFFEQNSEEYGDSKMYEYMMSIIKDLNGFLKSKSTLG